MIIDDSDDDKDVATATAAAAATTTSAAAAAEWPAVAAAGAAETNSDDNDGDGDGGGSDSVNGAGDDGDRRPRSYAQKRGGDAFSDRSTKAAKLGARHLRSCAFHIKKLSTRFPFFSLGIDFSTLLSALFALSLSLTHTLSLSLFFLSHTLTYSLTHLASRFQSRKYKGTMDE